MAPFGPGRCRCCQAECCTKRSVFAANCAASALPKVWWKSGLVMGPIETYWSDGTVTGYCSPAAQAHAADHMARFAHISGPPTRAGDAERSAAMVQGMADLYERYRLKVAQLVVEDG